MSVNSSFVHLEQLAAKGFWCSIKNFEYTRPKDTLDNPKAKLRPFDMPPIPYLFEKAFKSVSGQPEFGISRRGKRWFFHLRFDGTGSYHRLGKLHHITFYDDHSVELARNPDEHLYIHFSKACSFAYQGLYETLQFLILQNCVSKVQLTPWMPKFL